MKKINYWLWLILIVLTVPLSKIIYFAVLDMNASDTYAVTLVALFFGLSGLFLGYISKKS